MDVLPFEAVRRCRILADWLTAERMASLAAHLPKHRNPSVSNIPMNDDQLTSAEVVLLWAGVDLHFWEGTRATCHRYQVRYRQLHQQQTELAGPHPFDELLPAHLQALLGQAAPAHARVPPPEHRFHEPARVTRRGRGTATVRVARQQGR